MVKTDSSFGFVDDFYFPFFSPLMNIALSVTEMLSSPPLLLLIIVLSL